MNVDWLGRTETKNCGGGGFRVVVVVRTCLAILKYFGSDIYFIVGIDTCAFNSVASSARHSSVIVYLFKLKLNFNNKKIVNLELRVEVNAGLAIEIVSRSNV